MPEKPLLSSRPTRIFKNFGLLLSGRVGAAIMTVVTMGLMTRTLGVERFGLVVLVHTYILIINGFCSTKAFEAIVKFGLQAKLRKDTTGLINLLNCSLLVDQIFAIVSCGLAILIAPFIASALEVDATFIAWVNTYALVLLFTGTSTAKGVLRLYDRFADLGLQLALGPLLRLLLAVLAWWQGWAEIGFLFAWAMGFLLENLVLHWQSWRQLRREGLITRKRDAKFPELNQQHEKIGSFVGVTYIQGTLDLLPKQIATLLSGLFLGASAAGLFRVAKEVATVVSKPALLLRQAVFTDLSRLWETNDPNFMRVAMKTAWVSGLAGLGLMLLMIPFGRDVLQLLFGAEYIPAHEVMLVLLGAASIELATSSLHMAVYAMNKATKIVLVNVLATLLYLGCFAIFAPIYGLSVAGWAALLMATISLCGAYILVKNKAV